MTDRDWKANESFSTGTVHIEKKVNGFVDISSRSFEFRLTDEQAIEFAMSIMGQAARRIPPEGGEHG